jgi:hypothetical protein
MPPRCQHARPSRTRFEGGKWREQNREGASGLEWDYPNMRVASPIRGTKLLPAFYMIDKERRVVMTTASGVFTLADALRHQDNLLQDPDFDASFSQIMDLTHVTRFDVEAGDLRKMAKRNVFSPESRRAIIVNTDLGYGYARMFELLRESHGETGVRVFRTLEEALEWVLSKHISN